MSDGACTCERYRLTAPDGTVLEGELVRDPKCRRHGFPTSEWPAGHPLRRHARQIETVSAYQPRDWRGRFLPKVRARTRTETPQETEARLYREALTLGGSVAKGGTA